ncbi:MAG: glycosyl hydrolase [Candidatus Bathyarchaeota archaeon]|nr:glycosyl hydrolase [Candidatus Bathyarchaeota archaeon]
MLSPEEFKCPGKTYRPSPFWSWNDALDISELKWQVREFAEKGFGGYFMHSRVGLVTPYLSNEWMECVRACVEEAKKLDLEAWLYDEDKWPSGFAGGLVPAKSDKYRARSLRMSEIRHEEVRQALKDPSVIAIFEAHLLPNYRIGGFRRIRKIRDITGKGVLLQFRVEIQQRSNRYNGETYVDLLNPKVTREFLRVTLDAYAEHFKKDFGESIPGIFTDEPNYQGRTNIPWSENLPKYFKKQNGYDIIEKLPLLYFEASGNRKVRYDFWRTITKRFIESFTKIYAMRSSRYRLKLTGHFLSEDSLGAQVKVIGAAMPHYEYMQIPGIDHLGRNIDNPLTLKQCSSVAHQFGRTRVLSELFGCSGHSMTFEDQKWIGDFHLALGITFFCPHLTLYTMKGDAKRDYPPTISYHQPYWKYYKLINDYFARACYLCSKGRFYADILLLHPIGSAWATFSPLPMGNDTPPGRYNNALVKLIDDLLALHRDFDLGDEFIISRYGQVIGKDFTVKEGRYKVVIVPASLTWSSETYNLLRKFVAKGGKVIFVGETPSLIDGKHAEARWLRLLENSNVIRISSEREVLAEALDKVLPRSVTVKDNEGTEIEDILVHHRVDGPLHIYFLANKSRTKTYDAIIEFYQVGEVTEWDMFSGSISSVETLSQDGDDKMIIKTVFYPAGSHAFVIDTSKPTPHYRKIARTKVEERILNEFNDWEFVRLDPNVLVLDKCEYSLDGEEWRESTPIWKIRKEIWKKSGLERYDGIQPWVLNKMKVAPKPVTVNLRAHFKSEIQGKRTFLVIERASLWTLTVNGFHVSTNVSDWHWDKQFNKIEITDNVRTGENIIELSCKFDIDVPIEDIYLIGDFAVKKVTETDYIITDEPKTLTSGDWTQQGYPFYSGIMRYKAKFQIDQQLKNDGKVYIRLPDAKGSLFLVHINGKGPYPICWQPLECDITDGIKEGENEILIDVVSTLRNTFGPLHNKLGDIFWVRPASFTDEANWTDSYQIVPYGLIKGAQVLIRKETIMDE